MRFLIVLTSLVLVINATTDKDLWSEFKVCRYNSLQIFHNLENSLIHHNLFFKIGIYFGNYNPLKIAFMTC